MIFYGCPDQLICLFLFHCIKEPSLFMTGRGQWNCFPPKSMLIVFISPAGYLKNKMPMIILALHVQGVWQYRFWLPMSILFLVSYSSILDRPQWYMGRAPPAGAGFTWGLESTKLSDHYHTMCQHWTSHLHSSCPTGTPQS